MFICSDSRLEAAEGIDPSLCLVCLGSGICPDPAPLAGRTPDVLHDVMPALYFPLRGTFLHSGTARWICGATLAHLVGFTCT